MGVITTGYLLVNSWTDWKRKEIDLVWTAGVFVLMTFVYIEKGQQLYWSGLLPGLCLWAVSLWKSSQIGRGDGLVVMGIGWIEGLENVWLVLQTGILLAAGAGLFLLILGKGKEKKLPFVPFLFAGYLLQLAN